jgi:GNAT superfamily N-acetyltransferase
VEALIKLDSTHRGQLAAHLLALDRDDRANRFLSTVSDDHVHRYVDGIGDARDVLIGALQGQQLVALAHAAVYFEGGELVSEVGVSVDKDFRRKGLGKRLLHAALAAAKRFKVLRVHVIFRSDNVAMRALTRAMGARIDCQGAESSAVFMPRLVMQGTG